MDEDDAISDQDGSFTFICTGCQQERTDVIDDFADQPDCLICGKPDAFRGQDWKDFCKEKVELLRSLLQGQ